MKLLRSSWLVAVLVATSAFSGSAAGQTPVVDDASRDAARRLGEEGNELFKAGNYAEALTRYEKAAAIISVPTLALKAARCLEKLGRLVEASERYAAAVRMPVPADARQVHEEAQVAAEAERAKLLPRIPSVVVNLPGAKADVFIDGKALPAALVGVKRLIDPGKHRIEARVGDKVATARDVELAEGQLVPVDLPVDAAAAAGPAAPPGETKPQDTGTSPLVWVGVAGLGLGIATLGASLGSAVALFDKKGQLELDCPAPAGQGPQCAPAFHGDAQTYNDLRVATTATLVIGSVLAATGTILLIAAPKGKSKPAVGLGPASLSLRVPF